MSFILKQWPEVVIVYPFFAQTAEMTSHGAPELMTQHMYRPSIQSSAPARHRFFNSSFLASHYQQWWCSSPALLRRGEHFPYRLTVPHPQRRPIWRTGRRTGCHHLHYKDACKRDMKALNIDTKFSEVEKNPQMDASSMYIRLPQAIRTIRCATMVKVWPMEADDIKSSFIAIKVLKFQKYKSKYVYLSVYVCTVL